VARIQNRSEIVSRFLLSIDIASTIMAITANAIKPKIRPAPLESECDPLTNITSKSWGHLEPEHTTASNANNVTTASRIANFRRRTSGQKLPSNSSLTACPEGAEQIGPWSEYGDNQ
jgi:hypothetical protein